jgi:hypothetical protein
LAGWQQTEIEVNLDWHGSKEAGSRKRGVGLYYYILSNYYSAEFNGALTV